MHIINSGRYAHLDVHPHSNDAYQNTLFGGTASIQNTNATRSAWAAHATLLTKIARWAAAQGFTPLQFGIGVLNEPYPVPDGIHAVDIGYQNQKLYYGTILPLWVAAVRQYLPEPYLIFVPNMGSSSWWVVEHFKTGEAVMWQDLPDPHCVNEAHYYAPELFVNAGVGGNAGDLQQIIGLQWPYNASNAASVISNTQHDASLSSVAPAIISAINFWTTDRYLPKTVTDMENWMMIIADISANSKNPWIIGEAGVNRSANGRLMPKDSSNQWEADMKNSGSKFHIPVLAWQYVSIWGMGDQTGATYNGQNGATAMWSREGPDNKTVDLPARKAAWWGN